MNVALLIASYDGMAFVWKPAKALFDKYWPDRTMPMYWLTNTQAVPEGSLPISINPDRGWSRNIIKALEVLPELVILWPEELFVLGKVDNEYLNEAVELMIQDERVLAISLGHYYFSKNMSLFGSEFKPCNSEICRFAVKVGPGSVSTQPMLWRNDGLRQTMEMVTEFAETSDYYAPLRHSGVVYSTAMEQRAFELVAERFPDKLLLRPSDSPIIQDCCSNAVQAGLWIGGVRERVQQEGVM